MRITGALLKEQGVKFAVVLVTPEVARDSVRALEFRRELATVEDFFGLPIVLAYRQASKGMTFCGRDDIVDYLQSLPLPAIPWFHYTIG